MFKYYVVADHPDHRDGIHEELQEDHNCGCEFIPDRAIHCHDPMHGSEYNGIFVLTPEEAEKLKEDPRVRDVHRIPEEMGVIKRHTGARSGNFDKSTSVNSTMRNWALSRIINSVENYGTATNSSASYTFNLDGSGVDIIISDTGVLPNHPEFAVNEDGTGGTRVVDHDWSQYGFLTTPTGGWLGDWSGHGSNVAGIAAGNRNGWASKASLYSLRCIGDGREETGGKYYDKADGRELTIAPSINTWRSIKAFHLAKPITSTGYRRPTIVNCSWISAYNYPDYTDPISTSTFGYMQYIVYRGTAYNATVTNTLFGMIGTEMPSRSVAEDAEITSMIAAGVIVTAAAGNNYHKIDVPGGVDYDNRWITLYNKALGPIPGNYYLDYYHKGGTPGATPGVICVGAISVALPEHKQNFSATGPRLDIFCPGTYIMGPFTGTSFTSLIRDPRNTNYWLDKVSGTSQASPQVAGVAALLTQARPWMTGTQVLNFINSVSIKNLLDETYYGQTGTYTNFASLQGAANRVLYMPFNKSTVMSISTGS